MRLTQVHTCPEFRYLDRIAPSIAASRSASASTIRGACPPSSSVTRFTWSAARPSRAVPTSAEPVKLSLRTTSPAATSAPLAPGSPAAPPLAAPAAPGPAAEEEAGQEPLEGDLLPPAVLGDQRSLQVWRPLVHQLQERLLELR